MSPGNTHISRAGIPVRGPNRELRAPEGGWTEPLGDINHSFHASTLRREKANQAGRGLGEGEA